MTEKGPSSLSPEQAIDAGNSEWGRGDARAIGQAGCVLLALADAGYVVLPRDTAEAFYDLAEANDHHLSLRDHYPIFDAALGKGSGEPS